MCVCSSSRFTSTEASESSHYRQSTPLLAPDACYIQHTVGRDLGPSEQFSDKFWERSEGAQPWTGWVRKMHLLHKPHWQGHRSDPVGSIAWSTAINGLGHTHTHRRCRSCCWLSLKLWKPRLASVCFSEASGRCVCAFLSVLRPNQRMRMRGGSLSRRYV